MREVVPLAWRFPTVVVCAAKVRLACPLTAQGPQDGPDQPRQHEGGSTKDILVIKSYKQTATAGTARKAGSTIGRFPQIVAQILVVAPPSIMESPIMDPPRRHRSTPLGAATQIARTQPVPLACSSSHRTSRARACRERSTFIARKGSALGGVGSRMHQRNQGASGLLIP